MALQSIVSRNISPLETVVLGITSINGGNSNNVIPDKVEMKGICRTYNNELRNYIIKRIEEVSKGIAESMGGKVKIEYLGGRPAVVNSYDETKLVKELANEIIGEENVVTNYQTMCSEDFSYFLERVKGALIFIGCKGEKYYPQHNENFTVNEKSMLLGVELMYKIAKKYLY